MLTLPALTTPVENTAVDGTPSATSPEARQGVTTVQFGCNLVRADDTSDIAPSGGSDSDNTYTLIATPIECSDEADTKSPEPGADKVHGMATATVAQVAKVPTLPEQAIMRNSDDKNESILGVAEPSKSALPTNVGEVPVAETLGGQDDSGNNGDLGAHRSSEAGAGQPLEQPNGHQGQQLGAARNHTSRRTTEILNNGKGDVIDELMSLPPAPRPSSRIEDSVEALDKLEEQLEAMDGLTQLEHVVSAEAAKGPPAHAKPTPAAKRTRPGAATQGAKPVTGTARDKPVGRSASVRHSIAVPPSRQTDKAAATQDAASKRLSVVSRPASLAPPKPLVRSSKPPTVSTFELPGEAVAQRLKEKRLARLSMSMPASGQNSGRASSPTKPKTAASTKPPTRPNFELPGEAISRRKREELEARLKAEQEEERKRREFKARPVRASVVVGGTFPRQTAASRGRMSIKAGMTTAEAPATTSTATSSTAKRHSTIGPSTTSSRPSLAAAASTGTGSLSRGRASIAPAPSTTAAISRATSTSTGSVRGSSTLSAEDVREQKMRGKEIFKRESSFVSEKERERRSREEAAKQAREEAAERSRKASREWAEKQKARKMGSVGGGPSFAA